uniref:Uncharacterized protein n=1 Tax=Acrobeloides nanus TaxID=290746 RepID=A0A914E452_9BILA
MNRWDKGEIQKQIGAVNYLVYVNGRIRNCHANQLRHDNCEVEENFEILNQATEQHTSTIHIPEDQNNTPIETPSLTKAPAARSPYPRRDREKRRIFTQMPDGSFGYDYVDRVTASSKNSCLIRRHRFEEGEVLGS